MAWINAPKNAPEQSEQTKSLSTKDTVKNFMADLADVQLWKDAGNDIRKDGKYYDKDGNTQREISITTKSGEEIAIYHGGRGMTINKSDGRSFMIIPDPEKDWVYKYVKMTPDLNGPNGVQTAEIPLTETGIPPELKDIMSNIVTDYKQEKYTAQIDKKNERMKSQAAEEQKDKDDADALLASL